MSRQTKTNHLARPPRKQNTGVNLLKQILHSAHTDIHLSCAVLSYAWNIKGLFINNAVDLWIILWIWTGCSLVPETQRLCTSRKHKKTLSYSQYYHWKQRIGLTRQSWEQSASYSCKQDWKIKQTHLLECLITSLHHVRLEGIIKYTNMECIMSYGITLISLFFFIRQRNEEQMDNFSWH